MRHHFFPTRSAGRWAIVFASALVGLAVAAPLAGASHSQGLACQGDQGHWVSVTDEQGVPNLELVGATVCTDALTGKACTLASQATQRSPYPGWVQVTDETGVPWLYQVGDEPTSSRAASRRTSPRRSAQARRVRRARCPAGRR